MKKKRQSFEIQLNSISDTDNPTKVEVSFILHDFNVSKNYAFISKETAQKALPSLQNMPIVARYYPVSEAGAKDDALGSHEMYIGEDRETGEEIVEMGTVPIGVFTEPAEITTISNENGEEKEVVIGKGILWASRFPNVIGLLKEWMNEGIPVYSSMEILYDSYKVEDGVTEILNYVYEGHCVLNSEQRGEHKKVYPAYDVSKLTKLVAQAINQDVSSESKEGEDMELFKKIFELSHSDIRSLLYQQLDPTLPEGQYSWIADVYDDYFIVNIYGDQQDKYYKYKYAKSDNNVTIDFDSKVEVFLKRNWEEVVDEEIQQQLNEKTEKIEKLEKQLNEVMEEKKEIEKKFNETTEKVTNLVSQVNELKPYKEKVEQEKLEKMLNEKKEYYSAKFQALNAEEKFNSEEVQELITKSINDNDEGKQAILQLNSMLVDLVQLEKDSEQGIVRETASKRENLVPEKDDFDSRYGL